MVSILFQSQIWQAHKYSDTFITIISKQGQQILRYMENRKRGKKKEENISDITVKEA